MSYKLIILTLLTFAFINLNAQTTKSEQQVKDDYFKKQNLSVTMTDTETVLLSKTAEIRDSTTKLKFIILCFDSSPSNNDEISSLNKLAYEYRSHISSVVIYADDLNKYTEIFTRNEFRSLQNFILNKTAYQKKATSFPVILILDTIGKVINAWSGDKTDDGLKRDEFYTKIKIGLDAIAQK